jgi:hypothetical protein
MTWYTTTLSGSFEADTEDEAREKFGAWLYDEDWCLDEIEVTKELEF